MILPDFADWIWLHTRFFAKDEQLACYCGFPRCRGVVNDTEAEERASKLYAPRGELVDWKGEWEVGNGSFSFVPSDNYTFFSIILDL